MNYPAFTNESLLMMHHGARGALAVDDELGLLGQDKRFRVRETPEWIEHASRLEAEMLRRNMSFEPIKWSESHASAEAALQPVDLPSGEANADGPADSLSRLKSRIGAALGIGSRP
jgi:hypothetical protein